MTDPGRPGAVEAGEADRDRLRDRRPAGTTARACPRCHTTPSRLRPGPAAPGPSPASRWSHREWFDSTQRTVR
ncbi:putative ATP/GTP binding protein [Streptomyces sp. Tu6071]|nr:putative ATP/GTP binding protein [Streptomyces sp. Tu6071]